MRRIFTLLPFAFTLSLAAGAVYADGSATPSDNPSEVTKRLDKLQSEIDALKKADNNSGTLSSSMVNGLTPRSYISIAPFLGQQEDFSGAGLIINEPSVNNDMNLLLLRKQNAAALKASGKSAEIDQPHLTFSGEVEGEANYSKNFDSADSSDINLTDAELDTLLEINHWVSGYMTITYNDANPQTSNVARVNNSGFELGQGYLLFGNFDSNPAYASVGQMYVPFGQYSSYMVTDSLAKTLGRVKTRALNIGYLDQSSEGGVTPYAAAYAFQGETDIDGRNTSNQISAYGANLGAHYVNKGFSGNFSVSGLSNLAESQGMQGDSDSDDSDFGGFSQESSYEDLSHRVPGLDLQATMSYGPFTAISEYVTATTDFSDSDMTFNGEGAKPRAINNELVYVFDSVGKPSSIALAYDHTWESLAVGLPQNRWGSTYTISLWRHTALSFEYLRDTGYSTGTTATAASGSSNAKPVDTSQLGEHFDSYTLRFDAYF